jgi:hypothetical protein
MADLEFYEDYAQVFLLDILYFQLPTKAFYIRQCIRPQQLVSLSPLAPNITPVYIISGRVML